MEIIILKVMMPEATQGGWQRAAGYKDQCVSMKH